MLCYQEISEHQVYKQYISDHLDLYWISFNPLSSFIPVYTAYTQLYAYTQLL